MANSNIEKLAHLAKIIIKKEEEKEFEEKLENVMKMMDVMKELDCSSIEPLTSVSSMNLRTHPDQVKDDNIADMVLRNAPTPNSELAKDLHYFIVPKVME